MREKRVWSTLYCQNECARFERVQSFMYCWIQTDSIQMGMNVPRRTGFNLASELCLADTFRKEWPVTWHCILIRITINLELQNIVMPQRAKRDPKWVEMNNKMFKITYIKRFSYRYSSICNIKLESLRSRWATCFKTEDPAEVIQLLLTFN